MRMLIHTLLPVLTCLVTCGQHPANDLGTGDANIPGNYRLMFYNCENLFDTYNDSLTGDDDFTPGGAMHWTPARYKTKLNNLYKTIIALGGWHPPDIIGVCEVENKRVLSDLVNHTPLSKYPYTIIHADSRDRRGIDVALLCNRKTVEVLSSRYFSIPKPGLITRDILYCKVAVNGILHVFVNHWPSRSAGLLETEPYRRAAAGKLKQLTDSLYLDDKSSRIIIMGDFNDEPSDESLQQLGALTDISHPVPGSLYNLAREPGKGKFRGSLKYQGRWNLFDHIIVSGSLLQDTSGIYVEADGYRIFGESFLLMPDEKFNGYKPYRTYNGYRYQGGYSDHLPVYLDFRSSQYNTE